MQLRVFYKDKLAGYLTEDTGSVVRRYVFFYDPDYLQTQEARPISVNLPLRREEYFSSVLFPFFDNLLAEGWLLEHQLKTYKLSKDQRFELIARCGLEAVGAVSLKGSADE